MDFVTAKMASIGVGKVPVSTFTDARAYHDWLRGTTGSQQTEGEAQETHPTEDEDDEDPGHLLPIPAFLELQQMK